MQTSRGIRPQTRPAAVCLVALLALALSSGTAQAQTSHSIQQISQNTQPGWGKVYASASASGWYVSFFCNTDLAPGSPGNVDGSWEVFRWSADGGYVQVTNSFGERPPPVRTGTSAPSISDDGRRITFSAVADHVPGSNVDGSRELFLWREGLGTSQLTDGGADLDVGSHHPWISADGKRIAFASDMHGRLPGSGPYADAQSDIYLWDEAAGIQRLTEVATPQTRAWMPRLSGDGRHVAFYSNAELVAGGNPDGGPEVYLWTDGEGVRQLTRHVGGKAMGLWSAPAINDDGSIVAFDSDADLTPGEPGNADGGTEVYVWRRQTGLTQLTNLPAGVSARSPALSKAGSTVAFVSSGDLTPGLPGNPDGGLELFVRMPEGRLQQLTIGASTGGIALPVLSGGGELVTFLSDRDLAVGNPVLTPQTFVIRLGAVLPPGEADPITPLVCPQIAFRVPAVVQATALASPDQVNGWALPLNPALPVSPANPVRRWLSVRDLARPFSPANPVVWKAGCP